MDKVVRLQDIAEQVGVSVVTVSNALSGKKGVSLEVREEILSKAKELGYNYVKYKSKEEEKKGKKIGVIVSERYLGVKTSFYWELYQQLAYEISKKDCFSLFEVLDYEREEKRQMPRIAAEQEIDGLVVIGWVENEYAKILFQLLNIPVIFMDFYDEEIPCDSVLSNNYFGMYKMTRYLLERGHRNIAFVGTVSATGSITERHSGYLKALLEYGLEERKDWVIPDRIQKTGEMYLNLPEEMPTAFVCNSDFTAGILAKKLKEQGYLIPKDISVVGYDNYLYGDEFFNQLTTYEVDMKAMAHTTVKLLMKRILNVKEHVGIRTVDGRLIERNSVRSL